MAAADHPPGAGSSGGGAGGQAGASPAVPVRPLRGGADRGGPAQPGGALAPAQAGLEPEAAVPAAGGGHLRSDRRLSGHPDLCRGQRTGLPGAELERDADPGGGLFRSDGGPVCPGDGPAAPVGGGDGGGHRQRPHPAPPGGGPHRPAECGQGGHRLGHAGAGVPAGPGGLCDGLLFPHRGLPLSPHAGGPSTWTRACSASSSR